MHEHNCGKKLSFAFCIRILETKESDKMFVLCEFCRSTDYFYSLSFNFFFVFCFCLNSLFSRKSCHEGEWVHSERNIIVSKIFATSLSGFIPHYLARYIFFAWQILQLKHRTHYNSDVLVTRVKNVIHVKLRIWKNWMRCSLPD